jgi:hypothetical protein
LSFADDSDRQPGACRRHAGRFECVIRAAIIHHQNFSEVTLDTFELGDCSGNLLAATVSWDKYQNALSDGFLPLVFQVVHPSSL